MGAINTKQRKFAISRLEGEGEKKNGRSQQGLDQRHKSWNLEQSQKLPHGRSNEHDSSVETGEEVQISFKSGTHTNIWKRSKEACGSKEEGENFERGYQLNIWKRSKEAQGREGEEGFGSGFQTNIWKRCKETHDRRD